MTQKNNDAYVGSLEQYRSTAARLEMMDFARRPYRALSLLTRGMVGAGFISPGTAAVCMGIALAGIESPAANLTAVERDKAERESWATKSLLQYVQRFMAFGFVDRRDVTDFRAAAIQDAIPERLPGALWSNGSPRSVEEVRSELYRRIALRVEKNKAASKLWEAEATGLFRHPA